MHTDVQAAATWLYSQRTALSHVSITQPFLITTSHTFRSELLISPLPLIHSPPPITMTVTSSSSLAPPRYTFDLSTRCTSRRRLHKANAAFPSLPTLSLVAPPVSFSRLALLTPRPHSSSFTHARSASLAVPASLSLSSSTLRPSAKAFAPSTAAQQTRSAPLPPLSPHSAPLFARQSSAHARTPSSPVHPSSSPAPLLHSFFSAAATPSLASLLAQSWSAPASPASAPRSPADSSVDELCLDDALAVNIDFLDAWAPSTASALPASASPLLLSSSSFSSFPPSKVRVVRGQQVRVDGRVPFMVALRR